MAQIDLELNNQMHNFYTSEILILPKNLEFLETAEKLAELKKIVNDYLVEHKKLTTLKNISFFNQELTNFPIEEVRRMQTEASYSASLSGQEDRVLVLFNFDSASIPAQNAALKIIEESPVKTLVLLLCFKIEKILETIVSRCIIVQLDTKKQSKNAKDVTQTFSWPQTYSQAISMAEQYKDRFKAIDLIEQLLEEPKLKYQKKQILLQAYQALNNNQNTQLTLENCFFSLVRLES